MANESYTIDSIAVRLERVSPNMIRITYYPESPIRESEMMERDRWVSRLQRNSNELFERLGKNEQCDETFEIKRRIPDSVYPLSDE